MVCSCGACLNGALSPRMACRLKRTAPGCSDMIIESISWPGEGPVHDPQVYMLDYVPPELRIEVTRQFVVGFANCMAAAGYLVSQGQLPKPRLLAQMLTIVPGLDKASSKYYLSRGGTAEYALDALLARVEEEHEGLGDGSFVQDEANSKALQALPLCRNDDQFQLLRQQLFCNSDFWPCGPYGFDEDEEAGGWTGESGAADDDGWVHYDTSNWKPPGPPSPRPAPLPSLYHLSASIIDQTFSGVNHDDVEQLCAFLLDGDDGAPLQPSNNKRLSSPQPALSCTVVPPREQRSPPAAQPQTPFAAIATPAWPIQASPFAAAAAPAPVFTAPRCASGGPPSPPRAGDRALSWVAMWCARAEAEGIDCLPPPSQSSWQQLVASGSLSSSLSTHSLPPPPAPPAHGTTGGPTTTRASSAPDSCRHCGGASSTTKQAKRRRVEPSIYSVRFTVPEYYI
ncbi:ankyrin repeat family [Chlorella sorokiniana]|uniref:Ankyrin repeat family n=1 Tax=Chlorella sorokiniana TaxID=3076 RepID=A0A2P6TFC9_CHLSO|nr:ankyrin repeat family [Chlorella sorokiniana]|eukprot:PRW32670.1 ankyrin repeat family [Chlorella sorokiniana]